MALTEIIKTEAIINNLRFIYRKRETFYKSTKKEAGIIPTSS
jgi:hypothetical protein